MMPLDCDPVSLTCIHRTTSHHNNSLVLEARSVSSPFGLERREVDCGNGYTCPDGYYCQNDSLSCRAWYPYAISGAFLLLVIAFFCLRRYRRSQAVTSSGMVTVVQPEPVGPYPASYPPPQTPYGYAPVQQATSYGYGAPPPPAPPGYAQQSQPGYGNYPPQNASYAPPAKPPQGY